MPEWRLLDQVSEAAPSRKERGNEDSWGVGGPYAWVLDGATPLDPNQPAGESVARRFSQAASEKLSTIASESDGTETLESLALAAGAAGAKRGPGGHAAVAILKRDPGEIHYLILADIFVVVDHSEPLVLTDSKMTPVNSEADRAILSEIEKGKSLDEAMSSIRDLLMGQRRERMNKDVEGGYWVLNGDPEAPSHSIIGKAEVQPDAQVLVCSDGFARLVIESAMYTWREVFDSLKGRSLKSFVDELRVAERETASENEFVRLSRFDDATALLLT